jgi:hypothetical protein
MFDFPDPAECWITREEPWVTSCPIRPLLGLMTDSTFSDYLTKYDEDNPAPLHNSTITEAGFNKQAVPAVRTALRGL